MTKNSKISSNHHGIALVLSVLVLANLMMITLIVADVILIIGRISQAIGESEAAYYAAESAVEKAVYEVEQPPYDISDWGTSAEDPAAGQLTNSRVTWQSYIQPVYIIPVICVDDKNIVTTYNSLTDVENPNTKSCVYPEVLGQNISKQNPLKIKLRPEKSFELDFNITVPNSGGFIFYPKGIDFSWDKAASGYLIILDSNGQSFDNTADTPRHVSKSFADDQVSSPNMRARFFNGSTEEEVIYTIAPHDTPPSVFLPVGIEIVAKGYYNGQKERIIVLNKKLWKIY